MDGLFHFSSAVRRDPAVEDWMNRQEEGLAVIARQWFQVMRDCGDDVRELLHDGHLTACTKDAAFAYVNAFKAHVNVGFFRGAELDDSDSLLVGTSIPTAKLSSTGMFYRSYLQAPRIQIRCFRLERKRSRNKKGHMTKGRRPAI
jgi:hypothetical protein